jgi:CheY-like chemotaxis protein
VLVVDDDAALVRLMQENLDDLGYQAEAFSSSAAALQTFRQEPLRYAAIVTDDRMPGLSGTELVREMRDIRADLPAFIVSGHVGADLLKRAGEVGAAEVLKKPVALADLAAAMARCVP